MQTTIPLSGFGYSLLASLLFGLTPWYVQSMAPLSGMSLFWSRIIFSSLIAALFLLYKGQWPEFRRLISTRSNWLYLIAGTCIVATQWWLFVWAPMNGLTKELSLGYFLLPLTMVLTGRFVYQEDIRFWQKMAIAAAAIGIAHEVWVFRQLSWVPLLVAGTYPLYFMIRKKIVASTLTCFLFENLLVLPGAILCLYLDSSFIPTVTSTSGMSWLLPGLGLLSTCAMLVYVSASRLLPVSVFGLLGYIEPVLIFAVAILILGEPISPEQWLTYGFIGLASIMICADSIHMLKPSPPQVP